jgi:type IV pilus assembly protein PilM
LSTFSQSVIGLEIEENFAVLSEIESHQGRPTVMKVKRLRIRPGSVVNGEIVDPETFSEHLSKAMNGGGFKAKNIVVGIDDIHFVKRSERFFDAPSEKLKLDVDRQLSETHELGGVEFASALQAPRKSAEYKGKAMPILYAGLAKAKVDSIRDVATILALNLVAVDLIPLSILRAMMWDREASDEPLLVVIVEEDYMDWNVLRRNDVLLTRTVRKNWEAVENVVHHLRLFVFSFDNNYPTAERLKK